MNMHMNDWGGVLGEMAESAINQSTPVAVAYYPNNVQVSRKTLATFASVAEAIRFIDRQRPMAYAVRG